MSSLIHSLLQAVAGSAVCGEIEQAMILPDLQSGPADGDVVPRAAMASAVCALLFHALLERVPDGRAYVNNCNESGRKVHFDHGAIRTVDGPIGGMPAGDAAFARVLEPLGYERAGTYPLDRLRMTGRVFTHLDLPEDIPQFFVSELHVDRFSPAFQATVSAVMGTARDPLHPAATGLLEKLRRDRALPFAQAVRLIPWLLRCFGRQHDEPTLTQYESLLQESAEMAWIATEGNAFNHATDRVDDIRSVALEQQLRNRPIKETIEVSRSGRVLQTAFRASSVRRRFQAPHGFIEQEVPGSFYEFIQRARLADGRLDLSFDSGNATGIFKMTTAQTHES